MFLGGKTKHHKQVWNITPSKTASHIYHFSVCVLICLASLAILGFGGLMNLYSAIFGFWINSFSYFPTYSFLAILLNLVTRVWAFVQFCSARGISQWSNLSVQCPSRLIKEGGRHMLKNIHPRLRLDCQKYRQIHSPPPQAREPIINDLLPEPLNE